jgi:LuxR family maltose regulon positive regulatory protein
MGDNGGPGERPVGDPSPSPLLRGKLRAPVVPDHYIRRSRLLDLLDDAVRAPLTLVVAPAGVGKTVLLAGWAAESDAPTAWLSLDDADRDGRQLWRGAIAALDRLAPGCGDGARARLRPPWALSDAVAALIEGLDAAAGPPAVLVLDDLHHVDDGGEAAASLAMFLQHLPTWLHVVGISRRDPHLPLDRLRARGRLAEVRLAELRFSPPEARAMLARMAPSLTEQEVAAAAAHAAGWAAGLQLTALAARSAGARADDGLPLPWTDLLMEDYVWGEVLASEDRELVEVLLDVAVVHRVNPALARALTGRSDVPELLLRAEARGLFVTRLGSEGWFELHALVRQALAAELGRRSAGRLATQHVRAARWFQDAGEPALAFDHWVAAGRHREALRLLAATHTQLYDSGREATVVRGIAAIPHEVATGDLAAMIEFAWCHLLVSRARFARLVGEMAWWADRSSIDEAARARVTMLRGIAATVNGGWSEGAALAREAMAAIGDAWWQDPVVRFGWNVVARDLALSERWDGDRDEEREAEHALGRLPERRLALEGTRALGDALAGRPVDALRVAAGVRRAAEVASMTILRTELDTAEAVATRELGDLERAVPALEALAATAAETMLYCRVLAGAELVEALLDQSDVAGATVALARIRAVVDAEGFGAAARWWLDRAATRLALATGDLDAAARRAERVDDPFWGGVLRARVQLARGRSVEAAVALLDSTPRCPRHEVVLGLLRSRAEADAEAALACAEAAVDVATAHGMLQTVASEGPEVIELVERTAWRAPDEWLARLRRQVPEARAGAVVPGVVLVEPLTERERDILRFLPSRLTIREIAGERYVSVNTLKFHLKAIYRKLGVSSRSEAAEVARQMGAVGPAGS